MKLKVFALFFSFYLTAGAQSRFQKYFSELIEYQKFSFSSIDNSYVMAGSRWKEGSFYDFCVVKLDKNGTILWSKTFSSPNDDFLSALSISPAGDILLSGYKSSSAGDFDFALMKINVSGELQWYKTYGTASSEVSFYTGETSTGDFFLSGNRDINQHPWVLKTDNSGSVLWSKTFATSSGEEEGVMAVVTKDGGIVVCGALPAQKNFLMKINADGTTDWTNSYTNSYATATEHTQFLSSLKQTKDGGFVFAGSDYRCDTAGCRSYFSFIKLDANGKVSWAKVVDNNLGVGRNGVETSDGGFVFTGELRDSTYTKAVLIKTDGYGNLLWAKAYGNADSFGGSFFVDQISDGSFALFGIEDSKAFLIKTDGDGNSGCHEKTMNPVFSDMSFAKSVSIAIPAMSDASTATQIVCSDTSFTLMDSLVCNSVDVNEIFNTTDCVIYPNPFSESTTLELVEYRSFVGSLEFSMYDIFGRKVMRLPFSSRRLLILRNEIPSGMYFYEVRSEKKIIGKGKIMVN